MSLLRAFAPRPEAMTDGISGADFFSSSTLLEPASSSTLRARLRSPDLAARAQQKSTPPRRPSSDVYRRFRACFSQAAQLPVAQESKEANRHPGGDNGALAQLQEAFAEAGLHCYTAVAGEIMQAHGEMEVRLRALAETSRAVYSRTRECYNTISPLSATLCGAQDLPSTTIASHLSTIQRSLVAAQQELERLQQEWDVCLAEEQQAWAELRRIENGPLVDGQDDAGTAARKDFEASLDELVESSEELLDRLVEEYRALMQGETVWMMQSIMAA